MAVDNTMKLAVVVPNWDGKDVLKACLDSLLAQTQKHLTIVVENGSTDGSVEFLAEHYPGVTVLAQPKNLGFAGGVNVGIRYAIEQGCDYVALFNNDAVADKDWLAGLVGALEDDTVGIATSTPSGVCRTRAGAARPTLSNMSTRPLFLGPAAVPACIEHVCSSRSGCLTKISLPTTKTSTSAFEPSWRAGRCATCPQR